jgi:hypothetical protein
MTARPWFENGLWWPGPCGNSIRTLGLTQIGGRPLDRRHEPIITPFGARCRCGDLATTTPDPEQLN